MPKTKVSPYVVLTTVAKKSDATRLAKILVEEKLAACVTTLPGAESRYIWQAKLCVEKEFLLWIKTTSKNYPKLERRLKELHPYDCPEILGFACDRAFEPYLRWLQGTLI